MQKVIILSGVSGSGKSTYIEKLNLDADYIVSADHYFMKDGEYKFDPTKLSEAHASCFRRFVRVLKYCALIVVVDNTNTTAVEIAPYVLGAQAFGWDVEIKTIRVEENGLEECARKNKHGVSLGTIQAQHERIMRRELMPWWKHEWI